MGHVRELSSQAMIRERHRREILQLVLGGGGRLSRASLARTTGLTAATVSSIVSDLIADGYVTEGEPHRSTGGKPATPVLVDTDHHRLGAVVVEPRRIKIALLDLTGAVRHKEEKHFASVLSPADIVSAVDRLAALGDGRVVAAGVQLPGVVDGGWVRESVQLGLHNEPLFVDTAAHGFPVMLINDANAQLLAERSLRSTEADKSMLYVSQSTGLGLALMVDGRLLLGTNNRAGEIAHIPLVTGLDGRQCSCGSRGCLETVGAIPAMLGLPYNYDLDSLDLAVHVQSTDVQRNLARSAELLVRGIALVAATVDAPHVIFGGWAPRLGGQYLTLLRDAAARVRSIGSSPLQLEFALAGAQSEFWGAAQFALESTLAVRWSAAA